MTRLERHKQVTPRQVHGEGPGGEGVTGAREVAHLTGRRHGHPKRLLARRQEGRGGVAVLDDGRGDVREGG